MSASTTPAWDAMLSHTGDGDAATIGTWQLVDAMIEALTDDQLEAVAIAAQAARDVTA